MFRFIVVLLLLVIFVLLFQTRSIKVKGNEYYGENSIISWLKKDKLSMNGYPFLNRQNGFVLFHYKAD